jgi:hypothetical protein
MRVDRVSGRLLLASPELSMLKMSKRQLRQRMVVEAGLCVCAAQDVPRSNDEKGLLCGLSETQVEAEAEAEGEVPVQVQVEAEAEGHGCWCLFDEAADFISSIAARRVLLCSRSSFRQLMQDGELSREALESDRYVTQEPSGGWSTCFARDAAHGIKSAMASTDSDSGGGEHDETTGADAAELGLLVPGGVLLCCSQDDIGGGASGGSGGGGGGGGGGSSGMVVSGRLHADGSVVCLANDRTRQAFLRITASISSSISSSSSTGTSQQHQPAV